jgi:hypothetical protein
LAVWQPRGRSQALDLVLSTKLLALADKAIE